MILLTGLRSSKSPLDRIQTVRKVHNLRQSIRTPGKQPNIRFGAFEKNGRTTAMGRTADIGDRCQLA